ncbi:unnamed protein product, partial [Brugia pahangi]|uniref:Transmembrane protein 231 n=1 Tax=Brugia pahangi TaxID=6280 RepID=A0A0N4TDH9_BRUPA
MVYSKKQTFRIVNWLLFIVASISWICVFIASVNISKRYIENLVHGNTKLQNTQQHIAVALPFLYSHYCSHYSLHSRHNEYREQAAVYYKQRFIILLKGKAPNDYYVWSSYPLLNHAEETHIRIAVIEEYESDFNDDGKPDL